MARNKGNQQKAKRKVRRAIRSGRKRQLSGQEARLGAQWRSLVAYDMMIRDPCAAAFARAPYAGGTSGYMARINTSFVPVLIAPAGTVGTKVTANFTYIFQPGAFPGYLIGANVGSTTTSFTNLTQTGTFLSNAAVRQFRPVAACLKWIPSGPLLDRAGVVAMGYTQAPSKTVGAAGAASDHQALANNALRRANNGSDTHEVRWLPAPSDESYLPTGSTGINNSGACVSMTGVGLDGVYTAATNVTMNGILEFTLIVEWLPEGGQGLSTVPETNLPYTSQQYQSSIADIGNFLLTGTRSFGDALGRGLARGATQSVIQSISSVGSRRRSAPGMPLIEHLEL